MKNVHKLIILAIYVLISGCSAKAINPYNENYMCDAMNDYGECITVNGAYEKSLKDSNNIKEGDKTGTATPGIGATTQPASNYQDSLYRELASILDEPRTPMVKPPQIRRVLIMQYEDGAFYMPRYAYLMIDEARWILDEQGESKPVDRSVEPFNLVKPK